MITVKVQQLNLQHKETATIEVGSIPDSIYLLQEPYYNTWGYPGVRKTKNFFSKPNSRAAIYCSALTSFSFVPMNQFTDDDITVGTIEGNGLNHPIIIASIYLAGDKPAILPLLEELVDFCAARNLKLICGMDINAHSPLWGCNYSDKRGETWEEFIFQKQLDVHNVGNEPTWQSRGLSSIIDVTLSLNMEDDINEWKVSNVDSLSDHNMICFALGSTQSSKILVRNFRKARWPVFCNHISSNLKEPPGLWSETGVELALDHFYEVIEKGLDQACPKVRVRKKDSIIWWNQECDNARSHYIALRSRVRRKVRKNLPLPTLLATELKSAHRKLKYILRKAKRDSFREMVSEVNSVPAMSKLDKILDRKKASCLGLVIKPDGSSTSTTGQTLEVMLNEHFPGNMHLQDLDTRSTLEGDPRPIDPLEWITDSRIKKAIHQFEPFKAAGPDGLRPIVLQHLPDIAISYLRHVYTACIEMGFTPRIWCHSSVLFMPKDGKKSYKEPRSFRPISLSAFLFKGLERLVVWRVEETALLERPLHSKQFAFRKNLSTEHALTGALDTIESALYRKQMVITIDVDIKGAFDNISTGAILRAMDRRKIECNISQWYSDYLHNRTCETKLGGSTSMARLTRGCPQGGVASPVIAWNLPYDSFLEAYDGSAVVQFGFADDGKLIIMGCDYEDMIKVAQWALSAAEHWARNAGVCFSPDKSTVMFFNRGEFQPLVETRLKLHNKMLKWSKASKYLGITIDSNLSFHKHVRDKLAAAKRKLLLLGKVFRKAWGPHPRAIKWAYTGIVRPALTYGSIVWAHKAQSEDMKAKLTKLQRLALLHIAPVRRSTPTAALELLYDVMPLHLYVLECALKASLRIGIDPKWVPQTTKGHQHLLLEALPMEIRGLKSDHISTTIIWERNYQVKIGDGNDIAPRDWTCYTDGSKVGCSSGSGAVILHNGQVFQNISFSVGKSEVFQAEVCAVMAAAKVLLELEIAGSQIDFLVDSQAALKSFLNPTTISDSVRNTKTILNSLGRTNNIDLHYIAAHRGHKFNEVADANANRGRDMEELPENIPLPSKRSLHVKIENFIREKWIDYWEQDQPCRQTKYFISAPNKSRAMLLLQNSREALGRLVRFLTGHAFLRRQNAIVSTGIDPPPGDVSCRLCEDKVMDETPHHIITECDRLDLWRSETFGSFALDEYPEWDPRDLSRFLSRKALILLETEHEPD